MLRSAGKKLAHNSTIPLSMGGANELRPLQDMIGAEKVAMGSLQRLSADLTRVAETLRIWGNDEAQGEDLADTTTTACLLITQFAHALTSFSNYHIPIREYLKTLRTSIENLHGLKNQLRSLKSKAEASEKRLSKMNPEHKKLQQETELLHRLNAEILDLEAEVHREEKRTADMKREESRRVLATTFGGLIETCEKGLIVGEMGKIVASEIPHSLDGPYHGRHSTAAILEQAQTRISAIGLDVSLPGPEAQLAPPPQSSWAAPIETGSYRSYDDNQSQPPYSPTQQSLAPPTGSHFSTQHAYKPYTSPPVSPARSQLSRSPSQPIPRDYGLPYPSTEYSRVVSNGSNQSAVDDFGVNLGDKNQSPTNSRFATFPATAPPQITQYNNLPPPPRLGTQDEPDDFAASVEDALAGVSNRQYSASTPPIAPPPPVSAPPPVVPQYTQGDNGKGNDSPRGLRQYTPPPGPPPQSQSHSPSPDRALEHSHDGSQLTRSSTDHPPRYPGLAGDERQSRFAVDTKDDPTSPQYHPRTPARQESHEALKNPYDKRDLPASPRPDSVEYSGGGGLAYMSSDHDYDDSKHVKFGREKDRDDVDADEQERGHQTQVQATSQPHEPNYANLNMRRTSPPTMHEEERALDAAAARRLSAQVASMVPPSVPPKDPSPAASPYPIHLYHSDDLDSPPPSPNRLWDKHALQVRETLHNPTSATQSPASSRRPPLSPSRDSYDSDLERPPPSVALPSTPTPEPPAVTPPFRTPMSTPGIGLPPSLRSTPLPAPVGARTISAAAFKRPARTTSYGATDAPESPSAAAPPSVNLRKRLGSSPYPSSTPLQDPQQPSPLHQTSGADGDEFDYIGAYNYAPDEDDEKRGRTGYAAGNFMTNLDKDIR